MYYDFPKNIKRLNDFNICHYISNYSFNKKNAILNYSNILLFLFYCFLSNKYSLGEHNSLLLKTLKALPLVMQLVLMND